MDETLDTGGSNWADWFQGVAGSVISKAADAQFVRPYDIQSMQLQQLGSTGYYSEGKPGTYQRQGAAVGGMTTGTLLLIGGAALVAILLLKD